MSLDEDPSDDDDGNLAEEIEFYDELQRLATADDFRPFAIVLMNGEDIVVASQSEFTVLTTVYAVDRADGSSMMFPPYNVCAIRTLSDRQN